MAALRRLARATGGALPLIAAGGIASGADAYARIRAGASAVQLYSALVYEGPGLVQRIKADLATLLRRDGFASVAEAVGADRDRRHSPKSKSPLPPRSGPKRDWCGRGTTRLPMPAGRSLRLCRQSLPPATLGNWSAPSWSAMMATAAGSIISRSPAIASGRASPGR